MKRHLSEKVKKGLNEKTGEEIVWAQTSLGFPGPAINWTAIIEPITVYLKRKEESKKEMEEREERMKVRKAHDLKE